MTRKPIEIPSKNKVNLAGEILKTSKYSISDYNTALNIANQWRTAHVYPINTFQAHLRNVLRGYNDAIAAQRLKRMPTIIDKLRRHPNMRLSTMQDIGGVRAVVKEIKDVYRLVDYYENTPRFTHISKDKKDYIKNPKPDGYRGVHLIYRYHNTLARTESAKICEGLMVEVQIRSIEQHIWATAVEAVGMILNQSFKTHGGDTKWREFFELMSSAFAIAEEGNVLEKHTNIEPIEIYKAIDKKVRDLKVFDVLSGYSTAVNIIDQKANSSSFYHLVKLDIVEKKIYIKGFSKKDYRIALDAYLSEEKQHTEGQDVVLVSAGQLKELKSAYPNYFLDIKKFKDRIRVILEEINQK